jgi:TPR repeat protein
LLSCVTAFAIRRFYRGFGVNKDEKEAYLWQKRAAERGHAASQYYVCMTFLRGLDGEKQRDSEAAVWAEKSALQGCACGQYCLGFLLQNGRGVARDEKKYVCFRRVVMLYVLSFCCFSFSHMFFI